MIRNNKLPLLLKVDQRSKEIIKKILKRIELLEEQGNSSEKFCINVHSKHLN